MSTVEDLIVQIQKEAEREEFPLDFPVYKIARKEAYKPILYGGSLQTGLCFFGRDLGKDEVMEGQPLIGASGTLVREGFFQVWQGVKPKNKQDLLKVNEQIFLTNTVPYKPPGNKAYSTGVKERFRPFLEKLLVLYWKGDTIITLGTEAFKWFAPYGKKGEVNQFYLRDDRFTAGLKVTLKAIDDGGQEHHKEVTLLPLPHPSPLNQQYYHLFPEMLKERLGGLKF
ncbi:MAG: hypothetical protein N5P05_003841 [Chroococcopsis gigantea SAG 12.99]|jgi:uracil-DNA glycosylase|nr:uracil-DNA glycosylase [Chlorogloea purpurea SAG 13.99]MDV3002235.1 hypothetical protein [Chroococcopsis gigantea SAG 12.99]